MWLAQLALYCEMLYCEKNEMPKRMNLRTGDKSNRASVREVQLGVLRLW